MLFTALSLAAAVAVFAKKTNNQSRAAQAVDQKYKEMPNYATFSSRAGKANRVGFQRKYSDGSDLPHPSTKFVRMSFSDEARERARLFEDELAARHVGMHIPREHASIFA